MGNSARGTVRRHDGEISGAERNSADTSIGFRRRGQMMPTHEYPVQESTSTGTGLEGPRELHLDMQQTAVDGVSLAESTISSKQGRAFYFPADIGMNPEKPLQITARQEFVSLPISRQQQEEVPSGEEHEQFNPCG